MRLKTGNRNPIRKVAENGEANSRTKEVNIHKKEYRNESVI